MKPEIVVGWTGRRFPRLKDFIRTGASLAPRIGLAPRPEARPNGISAIVRVRGEAEWIEPSLRSVRDFADEILVFDHGTAPSVTGALEQLRAELGNRLVIESCAALDFFALSNHALGRARYRWVIRWDSDFVAHTDGPEDVAHLRRHLLDLDPRRYYLVTILAAEVAGDLHHQFPDGRVRHDGQAHTAGPRARYVRLEQDWTRSILPHAERVFRQDSIHRVALEALRTPVYYRTAQWDRVAYLHVNVKNRGDLLRRHFWLAWLRENDRARYPTLDAYVLTQVRERWGIIDFDTAAASFVERYCEGLVPYDPGVSGPIPELLRPYLATSRYRVQVRDGRIVGRSERSGA